MNLQAPIPDFARARAAMVDSQLRPEGVNHPAVVAAMAKVERERFVPEESRPIAYIDRSVPLGSGRFLVPPTAVGLLLTQLAPKEGEKALIVGAATGYSAAILTEMGLRVTAVECEPELVAFAKAQGVKLVEGPLEVGYKRGAPYDLVLIEGAVETIPDKLIDQMEDGGRLGGALIDKGVTRLIVGRKAAGSFGCYSIADASVPPLPGFSKPRAFTF